jgi:outer membrane receptor for ferrienterochelin and colicins
MKRLVLIVVAMVAVFAATAADAQGTGRIDGRVTRTDGSGLGGVTVSVDGTSIATLTDAEGRYALSGVPAGAQRLSFTAADFTDGADAEVQAGSTVTVDKALDWNLSFAETITVFSASRQAEKITEAPAAVTVLPLEQIAREAASGQLPKLFEFTPGAEVTQSGVYDYNFNTRGFNSSLNRRVATLIDGRDPAVPFLGSQEWAAVSFPLDDIGSAELVRGPSAALYGANASSGVLNIVTKAPRDSQGGLIRVTGGDLDTVNADARWAGSIGSSTFFKLIAGTRTSGDFTQSRNGRAEYSRPCTATITTDCLPQERVPLNPEDDDEITFGQLRFDRYFGNGEHLLTFEGGMSDIGGPAFQTGIGRVQLIDVDRQFYRLNYSLPHWDFLASNNRRNAKRQTALQAGGNVSLDDENSNFEVQTHWAFADDKLRLVVGGTYQEEDIDSADPATGLQTLVFRPISTESMAGYLQLDWSITPSFKAVLAGRYDDSDLHDAQTSPKAALVWSINPSHTLRATYNEAFQVANYSEFFLQANVAAAANLSPFEAFCRAGGVSCGFDPDNNVATANTRVLALGNPSLDVEEIKTVEVGYSGIWGGRAYVTLDYYQSDNQNFITDLIPAVGTPLGRINSAFGPYTPPAGLAAPLQAALLNALNGALPAATRALLTNNLDGTPIIGAVSYSNFGAVDTQGIDLGLNWYVDSSWTVQAAYSWFDFEIQNSVAGLDRLLLPNTPEGKGSLGASYSRDRWNAGIAGRWVDDFRWVVGPFQGNVDSYTTVDINGLYNINDNWSVGLTVANAFDDEHWESFGGDLIGRRALASVTFRW